MADRLPVVLTWVQQGCRPIPCVQKHPIAGWEGFQQRDPTAVDRHRWWTGTRHNDRNVALVLGPPPGGNLLVLNVNRKKGVDGFATLRRLGWDFTHTPTPTIRTPSGGLAHCFKPPDPTVYSFPFGTYVYPRGYDGLEFRGCGGIQLVPTSRTRQGRYEFLAPWTLDRLRADLADLPEPILHAWIELDSHRANISARDEPAHLSPPRKRPSVAVQTTDRSLPPPPSSQRSPARVPQTAPATANYLTTIPTALSPEDYSDFDGGEVGIQDRECAEYLSRQFGLEVARLDDGQSMFCVLPGHRESNPSATWFRTNSGHYIYRDWHARSGHAYYPVPDVFAALMTGKVKSLPKPSRKTWRLRLMVEAGLLDPYPVEMKSVPEDMPKLLRHFCEYFRYLCACKWTFQERAPTMFSDEFAAGWCGIREGSIWKLRHLAVAHGFMVVARDDQGRLVYLPGKESAS